jgi:phage terminase large subunit-like protein
MTTSNPDLIVAAAQRLKELERQVCFDGTVPGSRPNAFQNQIIQDWGQIPTQAVTAGNQSGKSALGARLAAWFLAENKPGWVRPAKWGKTPLMGLIVGRTMKQVEEELLKKLTSFFDPDELHIPKVGMVPQKVVHRKTGNTLLLASHHNENEAREKLQAFVLNFIWLDEMPKSIHLFEELERRVQSKDGWFISTFTPKVRNPEIRKLVDSYDLPYSRKYKMSMFANPTLSEDRKAKILRELEGYPDSYRRCILEGEWMDDDLAVYSVPDHAVREPQNYSSAWRHVEGADPALQSKHGQVVFAEEPGTGHWYVVRADYVSGIFVPEDLVKAVTDRIRHLNVVRRVCDAASTWYVGQAGKMGFTYVAPYDKNNRREEMMKSFQSRLGSQIFIAPWCQDLLNELGSMAWSETRADKVVNSRSYHLHDALIYAADCLPKPEQVQLIPELHVRLRMQIEKDRKRESLKNAKVGIRRRRW